MRVVARARASRKRPRTRRTVATSAAQTATVRTCAAPTTPTSSSVSAAQHCLPDTLSCDEGFTRFIRERASLELDVRALDVGFVELGMDELDLLAITLAVAETGAELSYAEVRAAGTLRSVRDACRSRFAAPSLASPRSTNEI